MSAAALHQVTEQSGGHESNKSSTGHSESSSGLVSAGADADSAGSSDADILSSYRHLISRRVDLIGDYAGDELFLIEGDSMLLRCFDDVQLDFSTGCQLLQAAYNVEHFLHHLVKRKCNFHIVFFDIHRDICLPPRAKSDDKSKYLLSRAAIIRHLQANLVRSHPHISVKIFGSWISTDFMEYLKDSSPYFVMAHDGAGAIARRGAAAAVATDSEQEYDMTEPSPHRVPLRRMIVSLIGKGLNVALINGLEWKDTKVMTMVLEVGRRGASLAESSTSSSSPESISLLESSLPTTNVSVDLQKLMNEDRDDQQSQLTQRQLLAVLASVEILRRTPFKSSTEEMARLCAAFLLHQAVLVHIPLSARRIKAFPGSSDAQDFLTLISDCAEAILNDRSWDTADRRECDTMDFLDGRLFLAISQQPQPSVSSDVTLTFRRLLSAVDTLASAEHMTLVNAMNTAEISAHSTNFEAEMVAADVTTASSTGDSSNMNNRHLRGASVLPFSHKVFDKHLASVRVKVDASPKSAVAIEQSLASRKIFQEVSHWHNFKRPIVQKGAPTPMDAKQAFWAAKRNQLFMAEMRTYAASLTNAVGKSLEPETIIAGQPRPSANNQPKIGSSSDSRTTSPADSGASDNSGASMSSEKTKLGQKKKGAGSGGGGAKTAAKNASKLAMLNQIAATKAKKSENVGDKIASSWQVACQAIELDQDCRSRYRKAKEYFTNLQSSWQEVIGVEVELYMLNCLLHYWIDVCRQKEKSHRMQVTALIWSHTRSISQQPQLSKSVAKCLEITMKTLRLPPFPVPSDAAPDRKLAFSFALPTKAADSLEITLPSTQFQLLEGGPYLERSFDAQPDPRVDFQPDGWQRKVLDSIDRSQSVFAVAPTSAGKTFISFYAMRKILEADDDGVLVYVAPTKALVNQIAAEVQARYSKKFKRGGKSVWAIHTRDYRINNPTGCQVLVTVPHVLQIMLLAPSNANSWSSRVKTIIFDEIHSIGQAEDGVVWEQLLLMAPCPIIALSATVGNPEEFSSWLQATQNAIGNELVTVHHPYRYSDLRKYFYVPPKQFIFTGIPEKTAFGTLGLDNLLGFNYIHPVAGLIDRTRGIPEDLALEARDCFLLWKVLVKFQNEKHSISPNLHPDQALPEVSQKVDILRWEKALKEVLKLWIEDSSSPYDEVVRELGQTFRDETREESYMTTSNRSHNISKSAAINSLSEDSKSTTLPLLCRLNQQDGLPAILFNYDRNQCEDICRTLVEQLTEAELTQRKSGNRWEKMLEKWEEWKALKEKAMSRASKSGNSKQSLSKKSKTDDFSAGGDDEKTSKFDIQRESAGGEDTKWESFDPDAPLDGYHFADHSKAQASELEVYVRQLRRRDVPQWLIASLGRGVGVHHAGMNRKYRQVVEILFRKGFLRVVIATGTLALGINMPCKTVVFSGDSVFLTALNYRQCAGRAGRRGFDLLGNIVFQDITRSKVCRLLSSRLPDLNGHFPITTSLVLRLFTLLHESRHAKYAISAVDALLSQPRMYLGGPSFKDQTMHHLRFSIEYLRRQQLLGSDGAPLNLAGLVSHLYYTENSSFAFHALLKEGYFHELCAKIHVDEKATLETLMLVMSHLFSRVFCLQADSEYRQRVVKPSSSMVFLPPMPEQASKILIDHNKHTLNVYRSYVETFIGQHIEHDDRILPLSRIAIGAADNDDQAKSHEVVNIPTLPPSRVRSAFASLSGFGDDDFETIHDLCRSVRDGVFLEEAVIPHMDVYSEEMEIPLNAYLLDFFKHGDVVTIEQANKIRRADIWFVLNDFSLVLATIITSLMNFMKLADGTDMDMLDVMGRGDSHEEEQDERIATVEQQSDVSGPSAADSAIVIEQRPKSARPAPPTNKQAKNADSWEDLAGDDDLADDNELITATAHAGLNGNGQAETSWQQQLPWDNKEGEGLHNVLKAFQKLHGEFNVKFRAMWA